MVDVLNPSATLLIKLGSIIVHYAEFSSPDGHEFDLHAAEALMNDPEVVAWLAAMNAQALLPLKRK